MTDPLFVQDLDTLKKLVRLSGVPASREDTLAILDEAILNARLEFYRRLGRQRVTNLVGMAFVSNPTTEDEVVRALANVVETDLVYVQLLRKLPNLFQDASGDAQRRWNEEAPFRERGGTPLQKEIQTRLDKIEENMELLAEEESIPDETQIKTFDGTRLTRAPRPGDSLRPFHRRCGGVFPQD